MPNSIRTQEDYRCLNVISSFVGTELELSTRTYRKFAMKKIQENHRSANVLKGTEALGKSESTCTRAHSDTGPRVWSRHSWTHRLRARQSSPQQPMSSWRHCRRSSTARTCGCSSSAAWCLSFISASSFSACSSLSIYSDIRY